MLPVIFDSLISIFTPQNLFIILAGTVAGIVIGALPGLTATMGVALMLPFTFGMNPLTAMLLLISIYCSGIYGGSITAILIKTPGTPASAATMLDGYALAQKGGARQALEMALYASVFGGIMSFIALIVFAPQLAKIALKFGPPEYCTLALFGLTMIVSVSKGSLIKGLMSGLLGVLLGSVGMDPVSGAARFTFGSSSMLGGLQLVPCMIGLFAVSQAFSQIENLYKRGADVTRTSGAKLPLSELRKNLWNLIRSSAIGIFIGALPGTGGAIASFLSYNEAKRASRHPEEFGQGSLEAIAASESGNNGVTGATFIPLLTLGVPGDVTTAVVLGALMIQGLLPGPTLFTNSPQTVYSIMLGFLIANIMLLVIGKLCIGFYSKIVEIQSVILTPLVAILCAVGAYAINNSLFDIWVMFGCGLIGYLLPKCGLPNVPILIGFILGPMFEKGFRQAMVMSEGSYAIFVGRPICVFFLLVTAAFVMFTVIGEIKAGRKEC